MVRRRRALTRVEVLPSIVSGAMERGARMADELTFRDKAAAEYDRAFAHVTAYFMPFLLRAAHVAPGIDVLDIATGTGLSAEAALAAVGPKGQGHGRRCLAGHGRESA